MRPIFNASPDDGDLMNYGQTRALAARGGPTATFFEWVDTYPMNGHAELGRPGVVCPFTRKARTIDSMRFAVSDAGAADEAAVFAMIRKSFAQLDRIPVAKGSEAFRSVILAFPNCADEEGLAMLTQVIRRHRYYAIMKSRMLGFMHATADSEGLWNPEFRPLRAPMPTLVVRHLVEQDAPFVAGQHLQWVPYLIRFGIPGMRKLIDYRRKGRPAATARG